MLYLKVTITDTMGFWDDYLGDYMFDPTNGKTFTNWWRVPEDWLQEGSLVHERREALLKYLYGDSWRLGNGDGSKYVVLKMVDHLLTDAEVGERPWISAHQNCYSPDSDAVIARIDPDAM